MAAMKTPAARDALRELAPRGGRPAAPARSPERARRGRRASPETRASPSWARRGMARREGKTRIPARRNSTAPTPGLRRDERASFGTRGRTRDAELAGRARAAEPGRGSSWVRGKMRVDKLQLKIDEEEVADLRRRLEGFRMPDEGPGGDSWDYGLPLGFAEKLHKYWLEDFDWAAAEQKINSFRHFRAILGKDFLQIGIHFIFALPEQDQGKLPIMLVHGWPGSFWEFHDVIPKLVAAGYPVVVPSLPGYGFSDPPQDRGWSTLRVAAALDSLMKGLGYPRYYAQGGDWGGVICRILGSKPQKFGCVAIHLNFFPCGKPKGFDMSTLSKEDVARLDRARGFARSGSGYQAIQGTRPQTLAYGLTDSPMGLACWIAEKFSAWADTQGTRDVTKAISLDDMLTNICIYWFTYSIASSTRLYFETLGIGEHAPVRFEPAVVPCALAAFPEEITHSPMPWVRAAYNVQRYTAFEKGGHFAALEAPAELAADILAFFDTKPQMSRSSSTAAKL